jgi:hypothetical protein
MPQKQRKVAKSIKKASKKPKQFRKAGDCTALIYRAKGGFEEL